MAQKHNSYEEKPMTRYGAIQSPSRRYRRLRHPSFPAAEWIAKNPLLQRGEIGFEIDTHKAKAGDGTTYWNDLPYSFVAETEWGNIVGDIADQTDLQNALDAKQDVLTAGTNINITGNTISATDTTYTGSDGITLTGTNFTNSGVRSVATGTSNGTISVNTNGTSAEVAVYGLGSAAYTASSDYATSAQGALADTAVQPADLANYVTTNTTQTITGEKVFSGTMNYSAGKTYILAGNGGTKLGYWSYDIDGQSNITLQTMTSSTRNINFKTNNGGKLTYNGSEIAKLSDLPGVMTGASAGDAGTSGLVPAPAAGDQAKFLQGDGTWANPTIATAWGDITGTLSDQTDLQSALNAKQDTLTAGTNINISGSTISATDTTYTGSDGVTLTGTNFTNSGVRAVASGSTNGTISVNTNGTSADVAVTGLGSAAYTSSSDYATAAQGGKADTAVQPGDLATVATTGSYNDLLNKPTIPAAQVNSDWNAVSGVAQILNKPSLATVATSGDYGDLLNKPTIPTVNNATLTIQKNGTTVNTFTANASSNVTANITVPTKISDLTNDSNFANKDLSNLTSAGANIGNWSSNITNCISELPQHINISINSSHQLELASGSTVYLGGSTAVSISTNISQTATTYNTGKYFIATNPAGTAIEVAGFSGAVSAASNPGTAYIMWFNTTDGKPYINGSDGTAREISFPIAIASFTNGTGWTKVEQVFNGFGYLGSTAFVLPGLEYLIPNGRNSDGSLKNTRVKLTQAHFVSISSGVTGYMCCSVRNTGDPSFDNLSLWVSQDEVPTGVNYLVWYCPKLNKTYQYISGAWEDRQRCVIGIIHATSGKIDELNQKTEFRAVDYSNTAFIAHNAMPSDRYIEMTPPLTNGTTYTAPADGYICVEKNSNAANQYISFIYSGGLYSTGIVQPVSGFNTRIMVPVRKRQSVQINFNLGGTTNKFRFIYAVGTKE